MDILGVTGRHGAIKQIRMMLSFTAFKHLSLCLARLLCPAGLLRQKNSIITTYLTQYSRSSSMNLSECCYTLFVILPI